jgi:hypothetical protein
VTLSGFIAAVGMATGIALRAVALLRRLVGDTGIEVSTRISAILVAAIAARNDRARPQAMFPDAGTLIVADLISSPCPV